MSLACIIIAHAKRRDLVRDKVVPSVVAQPCSEVVVVADYPQTNDVRWLHVGALTNSTLDALVKRDAGTLATTSEWLLYLSDDHALHEVPTAFPSAPCIGVPLRYCEQGGQRIPLNMGLDRRDPNAPYCAGHACLMHRSLVQRRPWTSLPHTLWWDLEGSRLHMQDGIALVGPMDDFVIEDLEPEAEPWH